MTGTATTPRPERTGRLRTVVVCDDREVMRLGLLDMLQAMQWASEVKAFSSLDSAWDFLDASTGTGAVAIIGGATAVKELETGGRPDRASVRVVFMLRDSDEPNLAAAAELPVDGYFLEEDLSVTMLQSLLARLEQDEFPMPGPMAAFLLEQVRGPTGAVEVRLSDRELAVLRLVVEGATNKTIADELGITVHGVKHHVANLLKQLGCSNRTEVASTAMRRGLVSADGAL